jgi:uncharacterized membrane protein SpoIIM required for sporulation
VTNLPRDVFVHDRSATWDELERLVGAARNSPERLGAEGVRRLGACYRASAADLAHARRRFPADPVVGRLEALVRRARLAVYHSANRGATLRSFASHRYWRRIRERPVLLLDEQSSLAAEIFTNNIRVTFLAFAGGILFGAGTVFVLIYNGLLLGAITGLAINAGNGRAFFELVTAHGVLELSCIVVAGLAGLRLGSALVDPGHRERGRALRSEARAAVELVLGTMFWLVIAGLVEGFLTPAGTGLTTVLVVGFGLGALFWGLVIWRGGAPLTDARAL